HRLWRDISCMSNSERVRMNFDRHIALSSGWVAGPAIGVVLMGLQAWLQPGPIIGAIMFFGGGAVFVATVLIIIFLWFREKAKASSFGSSRFILGSALMVIGAVVAWYSWPIKSRLSYEECF